MNRRLAVLGVAVALAGPLVGVGAGTASARGGPPPRWMVRGEVLTTVQDDSGLTGIDAHGVIYGEEYYLHGEWKPFTLTGRRFEQFPPHISAGVGLPNRAGLSVGSVSDYDQNDGHLAEYPMAWLGHTEKPLPLPAGYEGAARAVNDRGDVLLRRGLWAGEGFDFLAAVGTLTSVSVPGWASITSAIGLDEAGQVLLTGTDAAGATRAVRWRPGGVRPLSLPAGAAGLHLGPGGRIWGTVTDTAGRRAFVWRAGTVRVFPALGTRGEAEPQDMNAAGVLVGSDRARSGNVVAVRWDEGGPRALPSPWPSSVATAVDDHGRVIGSIGNGTTRRSVLWPGLTARPVQLPSPEGTVGSPRFIAPDGSVVGMAYSPEPLETVYRWRVFRRP